MEITTTYLFRGYWIKVPGSQSHEEFAVVGKIREFYESCDGRKKFTALIITKCDTQKYEHTECE